MKMLMMRMNTLKRREVVVEVTDVMAMDMSYMEMDIRAMTSKEKDYMEMDFHMGMVIKVKKHTGMDSRVFMEMASRAMEYIVMGSMGYTVTVSKATVLVATTIMVENTSTRVLMDIICLREEVVKVVSLYQVMIKVELLLEITGSMFKMLTAMEVMVVG